MTVPTNENKRMHNAYDAQKELAAFLHEWQSDDPCLTVHTSGSTGVPKPVRVEKRRMEASAHMTCSFLGLSARDTALLCMPLQYIAGKMVVVRSLVAGMKLVSVTPSSRPLAALGEVPTFAAMVPLQVACSTEDAGDLDKLRRIRHLIIGGGAVDSTLAAKLADFPNAVWSTYGMTETLSHIAMRRMNGPKADDCYTPLPGVRVWTNAASCLCIEAPQLFDGMLQTHDVAAFAPDGRRFRILGRIDNVIDSGGIKIQAEEVERRAQPWAPFPFAVTSRPDPKLGEAVVMVIEAPSGSDADAQLATFRAKLEEELPRYWRPRHYIRVVAIPKAGNGKIARAELRKLARPGTNEGSGEE